MRLMLEMLNKINESQCEDPWHRNVDVVRAMGACIQVRKEDKTKVWKSKNKALIQVEADHT